MALKRNFLKERKLERIFLVLSAVILALLFMRLLQIEQPNFAEVQGRLKNGTLVNLNAPNAGQRMTELLSNNYYLTDPADIAFAAATINKGLASEELVMDNIGELNKKQFYVSASEAFARGGTSYKKRSLLSRRLIGFTFDDSLLYEQEIRSPRSLPATVPVGMGGPAISGTITTQDDKPAAGVLVRLMMVYPTDSLYAQDAGENLQFITENSGPLRILYLQDSLNGKQMQTFYAYARTDQNGKFAYEGLLKERAYEVLPLQPGAQFGSAKGLQQLTGNTSFNFLKIPHTLRLFGTHDFNNLKREKALIVRTPKEAVTWISIIGIGFLLSFFIVHLLLTWRFPAADQLLLPVLMLLIGLSFLTLLSLQDPLRDRFLAQSTFYYFLAGMAGISILLLFDIRKFTVDSGLYRLFVLREKRSAANGWPWAAAAVVLLILTLLFGSGPEGSGVKVNLGIFQPSEVVKFMMIFFLAGFFTINEKFISEYTHWHKRGSFFGFALVSIVVTILLFLMLGDLGPAMVTCFTFILLFSFSRGDFLYAAGAVLLYILLIWLIPNIWIATGVVIAAVIVSSYFMKRGLSESAVMILVVLGGFMLLDKITFLQRIIPGPMQRLVDRKSIWQNPWDNEVYGGDHIANAIWGMASGELTGQGVGQGFAKTIPEAHTDMILPALGEEFGWAGILCIFILFLVYLHRSIIIGRQTGRSFLFYLCSGIGIATFVQFLLIAGGSVGALPLSGVSLPFMSYGGSSLIINLLAAGFLLSSSNARGTAVQLEFISQRQDRNVMPVLIAACTGILLLGITVSRYLFNSKKWVVQPALVANRGGARIFSYNPRIAILMNKLEAGTLYDRKGYILATSNRRLVEQQRARLTQAGVNGVQLQELLRQRLDRFYPFGAHTFFWIGDMNTGIFMGGTNGYFAEYEHMADLRGFPTPTTNFHVRATRFQEERFLPPRSIEMNVQKRDYGALAPLLLAGINSNKVAEFKKRNRDVHMTIDASLQVALNTALQSIDSLKNSRMSVVVMDAANGDAIASAAFPMVDIENHEQLMLASAEQNRLPNWITVSDLGFTHATQPGSTAKLITALAAFNKYGLSAASKVINVRPGDLIRVKGYEPDEAGPITIERGIVRSNNPFFIRLANEMQLENEMATLYMQAGLFLDGIGGYYYSGDLNNAEQQGNWRKHWEKTQFQSRRSYNTNNIRRTRGKGISGIAWGQGELVATPAAIARVASAIANNGLMMPNRYVSRISDSLLPLGKGTAIVKDSQYAVLMTDYMRKQSAGKVAKLGIAVAGKTGTPERIARNERINDGWYVFFAPKANGVGHIAVCVRIEKVKGSSVAVALAGSTVIPLLIAKGYIRGFADVPPGSGSLDADAGGGPLQSPSATDTSGSAQPQRIDSNETGEDI
jgi:cell division protein FtsW (lipid II flippase)/cell division protein FtsI/penicillin-binding protein 2